MKTKLLLSVLLMFLAGEIFSQACGTSGPAQCTPSATLPAGAFTPSEDIPCLVRAQSISSTSQFTNFDTFYMAPLATYFTMVSLRIDSISNLPSGLCWSTNKADNTFLNSESGCIRVEGVTYAAAGQYKLNIFATIDFGFSTIQMDAEQIGIKLFLRLADQNFSFCPQVDTSQTTANPFIPYGNLYSNVAEVSGKMFFDANQNQVFDIGEQTVRNQLLSIGNYMAVTNLSGNYYAYPTPGTLTIKPSLSGNISSFPFNPDSLIITTDTGISYPNNDFGIIAPLNYCEGTINVVAINPPPRPGFSNGIRVIFRNDVSAIPVSQNITFRYDARQIYVTANPLPDAIDTANRLLLWNTTGINSGTNWQATITLQTPQTVAIGTVLTYSSWVSASTCAMNEIPQSDQESVVVGSYDPNDKAVSPVGAEPGGRILPSTSSLSYTIRFQNTGTYLAENITVIDTISPHLNLSTLQVQAASHDYEVWIRGREVAFVFSQISLPDSNANEPLSHGWIKYSIQPSTSFVQNTVIENRADIYFDFNSPVLTNTTRSTADNFLSIPSVGSDDFLLEVYPNPLSTGNWQIAAGNEAIGKELEIFDIRGSKIYSMRLVNQQSEIAASHFPQGVYILRIATKAVRIIKL